MRVKSNRDLAPERMSQETVLDALAKRHGVSREPAAREEVAPIAAPVASSTVRPATSPAPKVEQSDPPSATTIALVLSGMSRAGLAALKIRLAFEGPALDSMDAIREAGDAMRRLGTEDGRAVDLDLRAQIAAALGWTEPPFPAWAVVGAYCRRSMMALLDPHGPPRRIEAIEGTVALVSQFYFHEPERVPAGYLRYWWEPYHGRSSTTGTS